MATITGYTAARMKQIEDETIVGSYIRPSDDHLILVRRDGVIIDNGYVIDPDTIVSAAVIGGSLIFTQRDAGTINAGYIQGPKGDTGDPGPAGSTDIFLLMGA